MNYKGVIIEESLKDKNIIADLHILKTEIEPVTEGHNTPWLKQWTLHTFEIPEQSGDKWAQQILMVLEDNRPWFVDFKNEKDHFIVFKDRFYKVYISNPIEYDEVKRHGMSLGIPKYQLNFNS